MFKKLIHYLFHCPTFWRFKPFFTCPDCGKKYRCYWDGHDCSCGTINLCKKCAAGHIRLEHDAEYEKELLLLNDPICSKHHF
jgi:hypothetical protein